jgi:ABC-type nickel/cobalt efflux system permease component RcnA
VTGPILLLGLLLGARHAIEADHVAAVAALAARSRSPRQGTLLAAVWGLGHAATLLVLGGALIAAGLSLPEAVGRAFEALVGVLLVYLGLDVLWRVRREGVHLHAHTHGDGHTHVHVHAHADHEAHHHDHPRRPLRRAFLVGGAHGLSGSGAAVLLALPGAATPAAAVGGLALFALGSVLGMTLFSAAITLPLRAARFSGALARGVERALGLASVGIGGWVLATTLFAG